MSNQKRTESDGRTLAEKVYKEFPEDVAQLILDLKKEMDEGKMDERIIDFLKHLETINSKESINEDALDTVSGGLGIKKLGALAAAAGMLLTGFGGTPMATDPKPKRTLSDMGQELRDLVGKYREGKITEDEYNQKRRILEEERRVYRSTNLDSLSERGTKIFTVMGGTVGAIFLGSLLVKYAGDILAHMKNVYMSMSNGLKNFYLRHTSKAIDIKLYETVLGRIETRLNKELVGQEAAIKQMINTMRGYFESVVEANAMGKKFEGGLVLYLTGLPATGKSTAMKIIGEEMGLKPYTGRMSDAIEDKGNNANTVAARLTKQVTVDDGHSKSQQDTPLMRQVKVGIPTLYCLDEIDKMRNLDRVLQKHNGKTHDGKWMGESVDEMLRNFGDTGQINGINASGSILIATSNETPEELAQLESSLYNRYKGCHVHFKSFTKEDYKEIIRRKTRQTLFYYKKLYNMDVLFDSSLMENYAQKLETEISGGRGVDALAIKIRATLKNYINQNKKFRNTKVALSYDKNTDSITAKQI